MRRGRVRIVRAVAVVSAATLALAACGGDDDGEGGEAGSGNPIVVGSTDQVTTIDPAGSYDKPSWNIIYNMFERLLVVPPGETEPQPQAAESCDFTDETTFECQMKEGLTFSDGDEVTAEDAAFSIQRVIDIADPSGPSSLFGTVESVSAEGNTVTFNLTEPDATFPYVLTTGAGAIVSQDVYPADELHPDMEAVGSGPYTVESFDVSQQIELGINENYTGEHDISNSGVIIQFYSQPSALRQAIEGAEVNIAYRSLSSNDISDLRESGEEQGVTVVDGEGTEINYMVLQASRPPFDDVATRQAVAQVIDREVIAESVYSGTVDPLYGPIPEGLPGHVPSFQEVYGEPNVEAAQSLLDEAGVETPVEFTLWYTPSRYGPEAADMFNEIARQLNESGLFQVETDSSEWGEYSERFADQSFDAFHLGWFPDFPDASTYLTTFYHSSPDRNFLNAGYSNDQMDQLINETLTNTDQDARVQAFEQISQLVAEEAPIVQLWQRPQVAAVQEGVSGVEATLDPSFVFRYWMVSYDG